MVLANGDHNLWVDIWTDSNFQSDMENRKFISKLLATLNEGIVSWKSSNQCATVDATVEGLVNLNMRCYKGGCLDTEVHSKASDGSKCGLIIATILWQP